MLIPKLKPKRSQKHLSFIRKLPCCVCRVSGNTEAAHVRIGTQGGTGIKPSDEFTVPLCVYCHRKSHQIGERTFWGDIDRVINLSRFLWDNSGDKMTCFLRVRSFWMKEN